MRIAALILATLLLLLTAGVGALGTNRSLKDAKDIDTLVKPIKGQIAALAAAGNSEAKKLKDLADKTGRLRGGAVTFALTALLALTLLVLGFVGRGVPYVAGALVVMALISVAVNPQYNMGPTAPASARSLAWVVAVMGMLGAGASYGAARLRRSKQQPASEFASATA